MLGLVRIARRLGLDVAREFEFKINCDGRLEDTKDVDVLVGPDGEYDRGAVRAALVDESYTMRDLRRDLNDLKAIVRRVRVTPVNPPSVGANIELGYN